MNNSEIKVFPEKDSEDNNFSRENAAKKTSKA